MSATHSVDDVRAATDMPGLLIHGAGPAVPGLFAGMLRSATNASAAFPPETVVELVVQGPGVTMLATGSELAEAIANVLDRGVRVLACENSMRSADVELHQLLPGVGPVPAAIAHLARRQWDGWAYIRI